MPRTPGLTGARARPENASEREQILEELVETAPDAVLVVDTEGNLTLVNHQAEVLFGYPRDQLLGHPVEDLVPERFRARHVLERGQYTESPVVRPLGEGRFLIARRSDGTEFPVEISLAPLSVPRGRAITAVVRDVTSRAELEAELVRLALRDPLTGLPNRTLVMDRLRTALATSQRQGSMTAVLFIDVDHLKWINDSLGHTAGDTALQALGERMAGALRPGDTVARVGGDEFVAVIEDIFGPVEVLALTDRLLAAARAPMMVAGHELRSTVSVGIALSTPGADGELLVHEADDAMYRAKRHGRDRAEVFREEWRTDVLRELDLSTAFTHDLDRGVVDVHYQPVIDLRSGEAWGVEALLRWRSPQGELVPAEEVVALAEQSQMVLALDRVVLRTACTSLARLAIIGGLHVGVNVSGRHLMASADLSGLVADCLQASGVPAEALWLELTEGELLAHEEALGVLDVIRATGVRVAIDDFGTGFSSLARLRDLPIDLLKIDQGFVREIDTDQRSRALVAAIVDLAHALGLEVLAEGVERPTQVAILTTLGCDLGQGFFWSAALTESDLRLWLDERGASLSPDQRNEGAT